MYRIYSSTIRKSLYSMTLSFFCFYSHNCFAQLEDFNSWHSISFEKKIKKETFLHFTTQARFIENSSRYSFSFFDFGLDKKLNKHIDFTAAYVFNIKRDLFNYWYYRNQLYTNVTYDIKIGDVKLSNRFRLQSDLDDQLALYNNPFSVFFYRNKSKLQVEISKKMQVYGAYEWYYKINNRDLADLLIHRTRASIGVKYEFKKRKKTDLYFMQQKQMKNNKLYTTYVLGTQFTLRIKK